LPDPAPSPHPPHDATAKWRHAAQALAARVYLIAEIGVNHDGNADTAAQLIRAAADAGADAVKVQVFRADTLMSSAAGVADYQAAQGESDPSAMLKRLELSDDEFAKLRSLASELQIDFLATPFSLPDVDRVGPLEVDAVKIASPDAVNTPLLDAAATLGKPMIISTGTCDLAELQHAADNARATRGALLHCVSAYPTPMDQAGLGGIAALRDRFGCHVGYSDHTTAAQTGAWAVLAGACVLEKHLTLDRQAAGPDHAASQDPAGLAAYVQQVRQATAALGPIDKRLGPAECEVRQLSRQSVCTTRAMSSGHRLTGQDLTIKRPGTGIAAAALEQSVGRVLARDVEADRPLMPDDLASTTL